MLFFNFGFDIFGAWLFSLIYIIFSYGLWFIFPKYVQIRFSTIPYLKYITSAQHFFYFILLFITIFIPFSLNIYFYVGSFLFILGLTFYIISLFFFSINEIDKIVIAGTYAYSRHPVYLGFFIMWIGISIASTSIIIFIIIALLGFCSLKIAFKEEQDCMKMYGKDYLNYKCRVNMIWGKKK